MLAASYHSGDSLPDFPLLATPKVDGVRAIIKGGCLVSRSFKPIPNANIRRMFEELLPEGADGELSCGNFYSTTSVVMSKEADFEHITFSWFDWAQYPDIPYEHRVLTIMKYMCTRSMRQYRNATVVPLFPYTAKDIKDLERYEESKLDQGYEGIVVRTPYGRYKCGRSTIKEGLMIKIKRYQDNEATIVGTEELMHNLNDEQADNFGRIKRSSAKEHLVGGDTLGAIVASLSLIRPLLSRAPGKVKAKGDCGTFKIGTGFTEGQRDALWANRDAIVGQLVKYKCAKKGSKTLPRSPVFMGIRHADDV